MDMPLHTNHMPKNSGAIPNITAEPNAYLRKQGIITTITIFTRITTCYETRNFYSKNSG